MTRFIVVLGITSHSGKSTIVAALCRNLRNRELDVAPFKSQNMSLNSWVTSEGKEMGIAQAVQARASEAPGDQVVVPVTSPEWKASVQKDLRPDTIEKKPAPPRVVAAWTGAGALAVGRWPRSRSAPRAKAPTSASGFSVGERPGAPGTVRRGL